MSIGQMLCVAAFVGNAETFENNQPKSKWLVAVSERVPAAKRAPSLFALRKRLRAPSPMAQARST
jgi:hypothetical protein